MAYAHLQVQFVCATCVYMTNVSQHENKTCGKHIMIQAHMWILHLVYHTHQLSSPHIFGWTWMNKKSKWFISLRDHLKTWWGWRWFVSIEQTYIHIDKQNSTKFQSMFIQMCWSNLILSFPMVWWKGHNCFEI